VRWTKGKHSLTIGGDVGHGVGNIDNNYRSNGYFSFDSSAPFTGNSLADFLVGKFSNLEQGVGEYKTRYLTTWICSPRMISASPRG
jgi:hypothetical protein